MSEKKDKITIGNAGEHFVAAELCRRGWQVSMPPSGREGYDIVAVNPNNYYTILIQVKTTSKKKKSWQLKDKVESIKNENLFYVFCWLNDLNQPEYHIIKSADLAKIIKQEYKKWLKTPGRNGRPHKPNSMRIFSDDENIYLDNWDILKLS